jgi:hypothetical protein
MSSAQTAGEELFASLPAVVGQDMDEQALDRYHSKVRRVPQPARWAT